MAFQANPELVNQAVQALAGSAPVHWRKLIFYFEFLEDEEIGLRNSFTGRAFGGENFENRLDDYELGGSMAMFDSIEALYQQAVKSGDRWAGILLTVFWDGQFKCRFNYGANPLLLDDRAGVERILAQGMNDRPRA